MNGLGSEECRTRVMITHCRSLPVDSNGSQAIGHYQMRVYVSKCVLQSCRLKPPMYNNAE